MTMLEWIAFIAGTAVLAYISRASLSSPKSHGFYRFIAWVSMLVLVVYNLDGWYDAPLTLDQAISGVLMGISLLLVITSYSTLRQLGQQDDNRNDATLLVFEKTTVLVTHGIYRYIRHPMYSSLIFLDGGLFFKQMSWLSGVVALTAAFFLVLASLAEEQENIRYFGAKYREYMKSNKRYLPFLL
ncbi:MAG: isoprenylcysteine carboxylmethyltransferase family protein [Nitrosomonadales bacterium]|nr:isoprenylcysteine carboxylmethyltransferase family protein [Nitrosomonadales bacterium]